VILIGNKPYAAAPAPTQMTPVSAPVSSPTGTVRRRWGCFSAFNSVEVQDKGFVSMDALVIGDYVKAGDAGDFSRIYSFGHIDHQMEAAFVQIKVDNVHESVLELTSDHMVFVSGKAARASEIRVGDTLSNGIVKEIQTVHRRGVYVPLTESGTIVVSGVVSSCFVSLLDLPPSLMHYGTQAFMAPHRLMCAIHFNLCKNEAYTDGISRFTLWAVSIVLKVSKLPGLFQLVAFLLASPVLIVASSPLIVSLLLISFYFCVTRAQNNAKEVCKLD
jgi:Hint module